MGLYGSENDAKDRARCGGLPLAECIASTRTQNTRRLGKGNRRVCEMKDAKIANDRVKAAVRIGQIHCVAFAKRQMRKAPCGLGDHGGCEIKPLRVCTDCACCTCGKSRTGTQIEHLLIDPASYSCQKGRDSLCRGSSRCSGIARGPGIPAIQFLFAKCLKAHVTSPLVRDGIRTARPATDRTRGGN